MSVAPIEISCFQLFQTIRPPDPAPFAPPPFTGPSTLIRGGPPQSPASLSPCGLLALELLPLQSGAAWFLQFRVKAYIRLTPPSTPVAARPVIRFPADLSQDDETVLVSTTLVFLTARLRRVHYRSSFEHAPARISTELFIRRSPPRLFTAAARTCLRPAPESRSRRVVPHHSRSFTVRIQSAELLRCLCSTFVDAAVMVQEKVASGATRAGHELRGARVDCPTMTTARFTGCVWVL